MKLNLLGLLIVTWALIGCNRLSEEERIHKKAMAIHEKIFTIDSHTDTPMWFTRNEYDPGTKHDPHEHGSKVDFPRMQEGNLDAIFFAVFLGQRERNKEANLEAFDRAERIFDSIYATVARNAGMAEIALTPAEAYNIEKSGRRVIFIGIENGYPIGNDLSLIGHFYDRGARYITLCHTQNNNICDSSTDSTEYKGLSEFGEKVIREMNRQGMMIDVSHISDSSYYDVLRLTNAPIIASHSSSRAVCDNPRNLTDEMLVALAKNGGVAQVCLLSDYVKEMPANLERDSARNALRSKYNNFRDLTDMQMDSARKEWYAVNKKYPANLATVKDLVDHIDHIVEVAGIGHVGIGSDFDGGGGLEDCYDVSEMPNITVELVRRGYSEEGIRKIWGGNLMRVMEEVQKIREVRDKK